MYISGQISDYTLGAIPCNQLAKEKIEALKRGCESAFNGATQKAERADCIEMNSAIIWQKAAVCNKTGSWPYDGNVVGKPSNSNAFAMNTNRYSNTMPNAFIPQVQTGYAASPLLRNSGLTRLADGGFDWSSIDVTNMSSADAKALLNVLPKTNLTPQQLAILNLVTAKANQGTNTGGTPSTTPDAEVEDGTKWIYGIAFGVLGGGLLWTILNK